jgi:hypothetical protein
MRWEDESYVKLYTRDTPTWKAMNWQAKALLPLLMRKVDKAGLMECGDLGRGAIGLMVDLPEEVAEQALRCLEKLGVAVWHKPTSTLELPKFDEAQEARKSDTLRKRESRSKAKAQARVNTKHRSHGVRSRPKLSESVTDGHSPDIPDQPSTDTPDNIAGEPANNWQTLVDLLFGQFTKARGVKPEPRDLDWAALKRLRGRVQCADAEIARRFGLGLASEYKQRVDTFLDLDNKWDALAGTGPPQKPKDFSRGMVRADDVDKKSFEKEGVLDGF